MDNNNIDFDNLTSQVRAKVFEVNQTITLGMRSRAYRVANELRNASQEVLRGQRSGRTYRVPGTRRRYTASAPGESPANRTGAFRASWQPKTETIKSGVDGMSVRAYVESSIRTEDDKGKYLLGEILEKGTGKMSPRPYKKKIQEKSLKKIIKIYKEPYF